MIPLPIDPYLHDITKHILEDPPLILTASPGSGKTTRVPAHLLRALKEKNNFQKIIVLVPKRIAALAAADRISSENNWILGQDVGYQVRFENCSKPETQLIFMTEGLFLKKIADQNFWNQIGYLILDEFHERSANLDLILGLSYERKILHNNLHLVVMSATLNTEKLKIYFSEHHLIEVHQRPFKLNTFFQKTPQRLICDSAFYENLKNTTLEALKVSKNDLLIFLPGTREILKAESVLKPVLPQIKIEILTGSTNLTHQKRILNKTETYRRIVLATNIAESSLTLQGIDCVIDSGLEKIVVREKKMGFSQLDIVRISKFSATQRAGRAARLSDGFCFKMWHDIDERSLPEQKKPEILTSELLDELLLMSRLGITDFVNFSWFDKPSTSQILTASKKLQNWNVIAANNILLPNGLSISQLPMDVASSLLFYELCSKSFQTQACELLCKLDSYDSNSRPPMSPLAKSSDIDYLFSLEKNELQKRMYNQLMQHSQPIETTPAGDFESTLLEIFTKYFPNRICLRKSKSAGLSASGRGVEFSERSSLNSEALEHDYFVALQGSEKNASTTLIHLGQGYSKKKTHDILKQHLTFEQKIEFKSVSQKFMKKTIQKFGEFIFSESSPETLSKGEVEKKWKDFVKAEPSLFLKMNPTYDQLIEKIQFIQLKCDILNLNSSDFSFVETLPEQLALQLSSYLQDFEDLLSCDLIFYLKNILPESIYSNLVNLPHYLTLPHGRNVTINYTDPKAPLISAKIQDCFSLSHHPALLNGKIPITIELLAPNMRPAQITNDIKKFWGNSYKEVRKELRARYPKHSWPEDVLSIEHKPANSKF